jgi:hypothetical protein
MAGGQSNSAFSIAKWWLVGSGYRLPKPLVCDEDAIGCPMRVFFNPIRVRCLTTQPEHFTKP